MDLMQGIFTAALVVGVLYGFYCAALWAERDALARGKSPWLVKCAVILFFPWGWIAWLIFRPDPIEARKRPFDLQEYRQQ